MVKEFVFDGLWTKPGLLKNTVRMMWAAQKTGMQKLARSLGITRLLPGDMPKAERILSKVPHYSALNRLSEVNQAKGEKKYSVGYFLGCATNLLNPNVAVATVNVLTHNGCEVTIPADIRCCGLPHIANGKIDTARQLAIHNVKLFNSYNFDYIVTDCASCSSALAAKNMEFLLNNTEYEEQGQRFAAKVMDLNQFLIDVVDIQPPFNAKAQKIKVTYHDPCHLANAQGIKAAPREMLRRLPGVDLVEMNDANRCCGGSGTYSLTHYDLSMQILDKKMANVIQTGADLLATCCPSCMMQLRHGIEREKWDAEVVHPVELWNKLYV